MNQHSRVLLVLVVAVLAVSAVSLNVSDQRTGETTIDTEASQTELLINALQQPHSTSYTITYFVNSSQGSGRAKVATRKVDNDNERYSWKVYYDNEQRAYGTPVSQWVSEERSEEWRMRTTPPRPMNHFSSVPNLSQEKVQTVRFTEKSIVLQVNDPDIINEIIRYSYFRDSPYTAESWLQVHIDRNSKQLDKVVFYTRKDDGEKSYEIEEFSDYGDTTVERPESIPFSLHERIRLLLYKLGLI